jgi:hypothetical protein
MADRIHPRLGARRATDERDKRFALEPHLPEPARSYRYWPGHRYKLDQGQQPMCVAFSWTHAIVDSPTPHGMLRGSDPYADQVLHRRAAGGLSAYPIHGLYERAQELDEFPDTPPEGGSSVRAGAKALAQLGMVKEYRWIDTSDAAHAAEAIATAILELGPVIVGVPWYGGMFDPDRSGNFADPFSGGVEGYHATKLDGYNRATGIFRHKQSWGASWGQGGYSHWPTAMLTRLIGEDAEACYAVVEGE